MCIKHTRMFVHQKYFYNHKKLKKNKDMSIKNNRKTSITTMKDWLQR